MRRLGAVAVLGAVLLAGCGQDGGERTAVRSEGDGTPIAAFVDTSAEPEVTTTSVVESGGTTSIVTSPPTTAVAVTTTTAGSTGTTVAAVTTTTVVGVSPQPDTTTTTAAAAPVTTTTPTTAAERAEVPALTVGIPWEQRVGGPKNPNQCGDEAAEAVALVLDAPAADEELKGRGLKLGQVRFRGYTGKAIDNPPTRNIERARELIAYCAAGQGGQFEGIILTTVPDHPGSRAFAELVKRQVDAADLRNMKNPVTIR